MDIGFNALNLSPDVFWSLTPTEIFRLYDGWKWRDERELERVAWQTTLLINVQSEKKFTVEQVLGREEIGKDEYEEEADKEEEFEKLMHLIEERRQAATL